MGNWHNKASTWDLERPIAWKVMCGQDDQGDAALGMGGVMLQSTEWSGGLRDRVLSVDEQNCESVEHAIRVTMNYLAGNIFKYHGI